METLKNKVVAKMVISVLLLAMVTSLVFGVYSQVSAESDSEKFPIEGQHDIVSESNGVSDISGEFDVRLTTLQEYIRFYYYFTGHNNWVVHDSVDCKLDVAGNTYACDYNLDFNFYSKDGKITNRPQSGVGNNNYFTVFAPSDKTDHVIITGDLRIGVEIIRVNVRIDF